MRIVIPQPQLLKTLQTVERAVNDRSTLPILSNVLLEASENTLTITATDLDVGIQCRFPLAPPCEQGAVTLPARKLTTVIRELPDDTITLEAKKNHTATVHCGASSFRIPGLPPEDFPVFPNPQASEQILIPQGVLKTMITQTAHAMSLEETRFVLNGALLTTQKGELVMVATDGRRLAVARSPLATPGNSPLQAIVPSKTIRELGRLLEGEETDDVVIAPIGENQLVFGFGIVTVVTRLIEGQFPAYEKVVPAPAKLSFLSRRQDLLNALRRVSLMTTATSQAVVFELSANRLVISKESVELGSAREELPVTYGGEPMAVAFNPDFWLDVLKVLAGDEVRVEISGPDKPAVIRTEGLLYLVLPMKAG